jgi:GAF domain-containing protein
MTEPLGVGMPQRTRAALDELALLVLGQESTQTVLQTVIDLVQRVMPVGSDVSITVLRDGRATTAAFTGQRALQLDEMQYMDGYGPCIDAAVGGETIDISDGRAETRWPEYIPSFLQAGALSSLAVPVPAAHLSAALNVYAPAVGAFSDLDRRTVTRFADFAAVALTNLDALDDARDLAANLRLAMESRSVIEQAKGILIERYKLTADAAFRLLVEVSMRRNRKVRDLAEELVLTGTFEP